jgi:hypothetical protein
VTYALLSDPKRKRPHRRLYDQRAEALAALDQAVAARRDELLATIDYKGVLLLEIGGDPARMPEYLEQARDTFHRWLT